MFIEEEDNSRLLGRIYDAAGDPTLWAPFIEELARRTQSDSAALLVRALDQGLYSLSNSWRVPEEFVRDYQEYYHGLDVWADVVCRIPANIPADMSVPRKRFVLFRSRRKRNFTMTHSYTAVSSTEYSLSSKTANSVWPQSVSIAIGTEFAESELKILRFLAPHLKRAFSLHVNLSQLMSRSEGAESALYMLPTGVLFLGSKGEIIFMNRSAAACVAEGDGLLGTRDGLRAERPGESSLLGRTIEQAVRTSNGSGVSAGVQFLFRVACVLRCKFRSALFTIRCLRHLKR